MGLCIAEYIIVFYDSKKKKVINVGSSIPHNHDILFSKHAEECAIKDMKKYIKRKKYNSKNIKIIIWKEKNNVLKSALCCDWCKNLISKHNLLDKIITPLIVNNKWNGKFISAISNKCFKPLVK